MQLYGISKKIVFCALFNSTIFCQSISIKGLMTLSISTSNDIPDGWYHYESNISYLPTFSITKDFSNNSMLDVEWAYRIKRDYIGDSLYANAEKQHRFWLRYSNEKIETRLGLQKIIFGPTQILRPLSWFDTFDLKDPTGETNGVEAFRLKWFPSNNISVWSWFIQDELDTLSYGLRTEISSSVGEFGFIIHKDPSNSEKMIGQPGAFIKNSNSRAAIDYRYDGYIGFWNESVLIQSEKSQIVLSTLGTDYTIPISNGLLIMAETMYTSNKNDNQENTQYYSALMLSYPIGIMHTAMYISQIDWTEEKVYNYLRWSSTFDKYSLNFILSLNPKRNQYNLPQSALPESLSGFGAGMQLMFIYNH